MADRPRLSICVPSRNRQFYFQQTMRDLLSNGRPNVEFVFADNSDDPSVIDAFMASIDDRRVRYLRSTATPLSMMDNWERTVEAASGDWVTVIGDDDYVDVDLVDFIDRIADRDADVDAIAWNRATFQWQDARQRHVAIPVSLANKVVRDRQDANASRLFGWVGATYLPMCPFTIYHGAVSRTAVERARQQFSGRYFEHPVVDYDFAHRLIASSTNFVYIDRPMSVLGVGKASNSAAVGNRAGADRALHDYKKEYAADFHRQITDEHFPFTPDVGMTAAIMFAQHFFKSRYGYRHDGWEAGFAAALVNECSLWTDRAEFDGHVAGLRRAFEAWEGGRFLPLLKPNFIGKSDRPGYQGVRGEFLWIGQEIANARTPADFYRIVLGILPDPADVPVQL